MDAIRRKHPQGHFVQAERFRDHKHFNSWIENGNSVWYGEKVFSAGYIMSMPYRTVFAAVDSGKILPAVWVEEDICTNQS